MRKMTKRAENPTTESGPCTNQKSQSQLPQAGNVLQEADAPQFQKGFSLGFPIFSALRTTKAGSLHFKIS